MIILCVVIEAQADNGAVHVLPNVIQSFVHKTRETLIINES
jgi:hypothetical protein